MSKATREAVQLWNLARRHKTFAARKAPSRRFAKAVGKGLYLAAPVNFKVVPQVHIEKIFPRD